MAIWEAGCPFILVKVCCRPVRSGKRSYDNVAAAYPSEAATKDQLAFGTLPDSTRQPLEVGENALPGKIAKASAHLTTWRVSVYPHMCRPGSVGSATPMIAKGWSPTAQLTRLVTVRIPGGKLVHHSKSSPVATQHSFRGRSTGQTAIGKGKSASPGGRVNVRSCLACPRSYCSLAYSAFVLPPSEYSSLPA